jgi:hypothetical protein
MQVYLTRQYQFGEEAGETRVYTTLEAAQRYLESPFPERERIRWKQPHPGKWFARIGHVVEGSALYVDALEVLE